MRTVNKNSTRRAPTNTQEKRNAQEKRNDAQNSTRRAPTNTREKRNTQKKRKMNAQEKRNDTQSSKRHKSLSTSFDSQHFFETAKRNIMYVYADAYQRRFKEPQNGAQSFKRLFLEDFIAYHNQNGRRDETLGQIALDVWKSLTGYQRKCYKDMIKGMRGKKDQLEAEPENQFDEKGGRGQRKKKHGRGKGKKGGGGKGKKKGGKGKAKKRLDEEYVPIIGMSG